LQEPLPILVGGSGERTLKLAARYADAANVFGDATKVRQKAELLQQQAKVFDRPPITLTQLSTTLVGKDHQDVTEKVDRLRPRNQDPARYAASVNAGTIQDQIGRFRELAEAGAGEVMLSLPDLDDDLTPLDTFAEVISAFR